jgi:hypothetical protein
VALSERGLGRRGSGASVILIAIFLASVAARVYAAGLRTTPLYYPDEYIYTALARSIAATGLPSLRGATLQFPSLFAPYLMAPAWLIGNVRVAYHVVLDMGSVAFSAAVFPAYALARKVGITVRGALIVALLSILVPDAAFATTALTEPYAYPIFLTMIVVAIDSIVAPTRFRQFAIVVLMGALTFARVQFVFVFVIYALAALVHARGSVRRVLRAQPGVAVVLLVGLASVAIVGPGRLVGFYKFPTDGHVIVSTWVWFGMDLFVLAVAAGWVVIPGALVGLASLLRSVDQRQRVFAVLTLGVTFAVVAQAAYVDAFQHRVHERYTFYVVPLLVVACMWAAEAVAASRFYSLAAYALGVIAILVPASESLRSADSGQSPTLLGLDQFGGSGSTARLVWAVGLTIAIVAVGLFRSRPHVWMVLAVLISGGICVAGTRALLDFIPARGSDAAAHDLSLFRLGAPPKAALVTWTGTDQFTLMKTLFWTPTVDRVLVLGSSKASDGFGATQASFEPRLGFVDRLGRPVAGPFAFAPDTTAIASELSSSSKDAPWLRSAPVALIIGLDREDRYLSTVSELLVTAGSRPSTVRLQLKNTGTPRTMTLACPSREFDVRLGQLSRWVRIKVGTSGTTRCRISLTKGAAVERHNRLTSGVRVTRLAIHQAAH